LSNTDAEEGSTILSLKVVPGASTEGVVGWLGDALKVRVRAPAERGKANAAVIQIVAKALERSPGTMRIKTGLTSARKTIEIGGLSMEEIRERLT